jgi:ABC-type transporter Mla subunit MlaD
MIKALIAKVIDLGTAVKDTSELIRQLPNQQDALERWNEQSDKLAGNIGKLEKYMQQMTGAFDKQLQGFAGQMKGLDRQLVGMDEMHQ